MVDCDLTLFPDSHGRSGIWVGVGGTLSMTNVTVSTYSFADVFIFDVQGTASFEGCVFDGMPLSREHRAGACTMHILSDGVELMRCAFNRSEGDSLVVVDSSPRITECTFQSTQRACIRVQGGGPAIEGCTFTNFGEGVNLTDSEATLESCAFVYGGVGVRARSSAATVVDCSFDDMADFCIMSSWNSPVDATSNSFSDTATLHEGSSDWWELAVPAGPMVLALVVLVGFVNLGRRERKAPRTARRTSNDY
jgi:hypothetical protein